MATMKRRNLKDFLKVNLDRGLKGVLLISAIQHQTEFLAGRVHFEVQ
jgi:hypothetical protein